MSNKCLEQVVKYSHKPFMYVVKKIIGGEFIKENHMYQVNRDILFECFFLQSSWSRKRMLGLMNWVVGYLISYFWETLDIIFQIVGRILIIFYHIHYSVIQHIGKYVLSLLVLTIWDENLFDIKKSII